MIITFHLCDTAVCFEKIFSLCLLSLPGNGTDIWTWPGSFGGKTERRVDLIWCYYYQNNMYTGSHAF